MKNRGFEVAKNFLDQGIMIPKRATAYSAGYDLQAGEDVVVKPQEVVLVKTGLKAYMQENEVLKIYIRSSMAVKRHAMLANQVGIIDRDYYNNPENDGHIMIPIINFGKDELFIKKGEKIAQGVFEVFLLADHDEIIDEKRVGGFGSSNKNIK
jgi:dUTP pyrophosphatase